MQISIRIEFDPWVLDPEAGRANGVFGANIIGATSDGYWIAHLTRAVHTDGEGYSYVALLPRYTGQPIISREAEFPYTAGAVFLSEEQTHDSSLKKAELIKMPGLTGTVYLT